MILLTRCSKNSCLTSSQEEKIPQSLTAETHLKVGAIYSSDLLEQRPQKLCKQTVRTN